MKRKDWHKTDEERALDGDYMPETRLSLIMMWMNPDGTSYSTIKVDGKMVRATPEVMIPLIEEELKRLDCLIAKDEEEESEYFDQLMK